jgi:hypothetical protein
VIADELIAGLAIVRINRIWFLEQKQQPKDEVPDRERWGVSLPEDVQVNTTLGSKFS